MEMQQQEQTNPQQLNGGYQQPNTGIVERARQQADVAKKLIAELVDSKTQIYSDTEIKISEIDKALAELGHVARPVKQMTGERDDGLKFCKVCDKNIGHDARRHRGQKHPRPFNAAELAEVNRKIDAKRAG